MSVNKKKVVAQSAVDLKTIPQPSFWAQRVKSFEKLWNEQQASYEAKKCSIEVTLPNGNVIAAQSWTSCPLDIAKKLSNSLPDKVIVAKVNDQLWDLTRPFEESCTLELLDWDDKDAQTVFWHSSSHVLGYAMQRVFNTKLSVGPALEEGGFFYEGLTERPVSESDYRSIEAAMQELVKSKMPFQRLVARKEDAIQLFRYTDFKCKMLINKVPDGGYCTVYRCGMLIDPCRGPHLPDTGRVKAVAITKNSSSYYEGKAENEVLQRVYGISFPKASLLTQWKKVQEEAAKRDHRVIGRQQQLFLFNEVSPGSAFWLPHGARIFNTLMELQRKQYRKRGFEEVVSPNIFSSKLWMVSGHWDKYAQNMFRTICEKEEYGLKPMNCPGHCIMFAMQPHSYKELPIRYADFGVLHRNELSGALTGLTRVRRFQQDDAHIFCRMDQVPQEMGQALHFLKQIYDILGFKLFFRHSTRPENKLGSQEVWNEAEMHLRDALNKFFDIPHELPDPFVQGKTFAFDGTPSSLKKIKAIMKKIERDGVQNGQWPGPSHADVWQENTGDGAFYGPKIDIVVQDALKRRHQCATIQLDFNLPNRFGLKYTLPTATEKEHENATQHANHERQSKNDDGSSAINCNKTCKKETNVNAADEHKETNGHAHVCNKKATPATYELAVKELGIDLTLDANQVRPVMIHRAILGSVERCIAILCEHYGGDWPFWLSPRQVMVVPISNASVQYAKKVKENIMGEGFYVDVDLGAATLEKKIRNAELARYNFIFVVGAKEEEAGSVNIRARGERRLGNKTLHEATQWLHELAKTYSKEY